MATIPPTDPDRTLGEPAIDGPTPLQVALVGVFLVSLAAVAGLRVVLTAEDTTPFATIAADLRQALATADGPLAANRGVLEAIDAFEATLEDTSPLREAALPRVQRALVEHGGVGNETVYVGCDGWLVLREAYDAAVGPPFLDPRVLARRRAAGPTWEEPPCPDPRPAILDFARQLEARGVELLVLLVPAKVTVHPEALCAPDPAPEPASGGARNPSIDPWIEALESAGVSVLDATPILATLRADGVPAFLRTDSHWTPAGVDATARAVADRIRPWLDGKGASDDAEWWLRSPLRADGRGDLHHQLRLPDEETGEPLFARQSVDVERVSTADDRLWQPTVGASVLLLGDSFTNVFSDPQLGWQRAGGLGEQISYHLGQRIDRLAINAGSASAVRERLASDPQRLEALDASVEVVVWQIAARELAHGDWRLVELP